MEKAKNKTAEFFGKIGNSIKNFFVSLPQRFKKKFAGAKEILTQGNGKVCASMCVMGLGQLLYKQWVKGALFLMVEIAFILFFVFSGANHSGQRDFYR